LCPATERAEVTQTDARSAHAAAAGKDAWVQRLRKGGWWGWQGRFECAIEIAPMKGRWRAPG